MKFLLLEQKYLELLDENHIPDALNCLRYELTPLNHKRNRVHELSRFVFMLRLIYVIAMLITW